MFLSVCWACWKHRPFGSNEKYILHISRPDSCPPMLVLVFSSTGLKLRILFVCNCHLALRHTVGSGPWKYNTLSSVHVCFHEQDLPPYRRKRLLQDIQQVPYHCYCKGTLSCGPPRDMNCHEDRLGRGRHQAAATLPFVSVPSKVSCLF